MARYEEENMTIRDLIKRAIEQNVNNNVTKEDKENLLNEIADSEDFHQKLDAIIVDALDEWISFLEIDLK